MLDEMLKLEDIPEFMMKQLRGKSQRQKMDFMKQFLIIMLRRNQLLSEAIGNFEFVFKLKLPRHIKALILAEKELFDNKQKCDSTRIEQLCIFFIKNSPICEDSVINVKLNKAKQIVGAVFS